MSSSSSIRRLPPEVVNRIAAGEVLTRPSHAVKELLENALDAGATRVRVTCVRGGLDLLRVEDDGGGIEAESLPLVCERFATSKLRAFDELRTLGSYGFRGEAMSALSQVARVTIVSKRAADATAFKCEYEGGRAVGALSRVAGPDGTTVIARQLFFNCPSRRACFAPADEFDRVVAVVASLAVHRPDVSFAVSNGAETRFRTKGNACRQSVISELFDARNCFALLQSECASAEFEFALRLCLAKPLASLTSESAKKRTPSTNLLLYVNDRAICSDAIRHSLRAALADRDLTCPFAYMSIQVSPGSIDVNIDPTKAKVAFVCEEWILFTIKKEIERILDENNQAVSSAPIIDRTHSSQTAVSSSQSATPNRDRKSLTLTRKDHEVVRSDASQRSLHEYMGEGSSLLEDDASCTRENESAAFASFVQAEVQRIDSESNASYASFLKDCQFVGMRSSAEALLQKGSALYAADFALLSEHCFYQALLTAPSSAFEFEPPLHLNELCEIASTYLAATLSVANIVPVLECLQHFGVEITAQGNTFLLKSLPKPFPGAEIQRANLLTLLRDLATIAASDTSIRYAKVAKILANFYVYDDATGDLDDDVPRWRQIAQSTIWPRIRDSLKPPAAWRAGQHFKLLTDCTELYKLFERC